MRIYLDSETLTTKDQKVIDWLAGALKAPGSNDLMKRATSSNGDIHVRVKLRPHSKRRG